MCVCIGDKQFMRKIIIFAIMLFSCINAVSYGVCPINSLGVCQAEILRQDLGNPNLQDRLIPSRINNMEQPNSVMQDRTQQGQSQSPPQINQQLFQQEMTQPYNSNCQFGNCINNTNSGIYHN